MTTTKRKHDELKIDGPPLLSCVHNICTAFTTPQKKSSSTTFSTTFSTNNDNDPSSSYNDPSSSSPSFNSSTSNYCPSLDASKTALLVIDVQPEYWSECPPVRRDFPDFPTHLSSLLHNCRSQHMKRIIWVRADYSFEHSPWLNQFARLHKGRIPPVVRPSSKWEEFAQPIENEMVITKTSWSVTSGGTGLLHTLKSDGIDTVLVCGLITSVCVQHSAFGVFEAGYRTILVTDACADRGRGRHEAALALYGDYMYEMRSVDSLKLELDEQEEAKMKNMMKKKQKSDDDDDDEANIKKESSIMEGVSVSLPFHKDGASDHDVGRRDKKKMMITMIKLESDDSSTSAASYDVLVSRQ